MHEACLLHELILLGAERSPDAPALTYGSQTLGYQSLAAQVQRAAGGLLALGLGRSERVSG
jgi:non-ribosomal peptide synthetase component E (peptide arylation enzyme)